jgi:TIR domain-containing protein
MVILSQHSIDSSWVEFEVKRALQKEHEQGKLVLFPLKLDETVAETPEAWAAAIRKQRHIGDFTNWKNHDAYQKSFIRLLRDLKAELPSRL